MSKPGWESVWTVRAMLAIEAAGETEARDIGNEVLRQMEVVLDGQLKVHAFREQVWTVIAEVDLSSLPVIEPDNAHTRSPT